MNIREYEELLESTVSPLMQLIKSRPNTSMFSGIYFCFVGKMPEAREKYMAAINALWGLVDSGVLLDTTFLVVPNTKIKSAKVNKAKMFGVRIITIEQFMEALDHFGVSL